MNYSHFEITKNEARDVLRQFLGEWCPRYNPYMLSYVPPEGSLNECHQNNDDEDLSFVYRWENCALKGPLRWTEKHQIYTWFMGECHLLIISSTITHFTDLLQSHRGKSQTGSLFCFFRPGTWSCSWSAYRYRGHKDHLRWKGCGSVAWLDLTGSSGLQWLGSL